jgi:hypothetical protein
MLANNPMLRLTASGNLRPSARVRKLNPNAVSSKIHFNRIEIENDGHYGNGVDTLYIMDASDTITSPVAWPVTVSVWLARALPITG